jgi:hypothetical protein
MDIGPHSFPRPAGAISRKARKAPSTASETDSQLSFAGQAGPPINVSTKPNALDSKLLALEMKVTELEITVAELEIIKTSLVDRLSA